VVPPLRACSRPPSAVGRPGHSAKTSAIKAAARSERTRRGLHTEVTASLRAFLILWGVKPKTLKRDHLFKLIDEHELGAELSKNERYNEACKQLEDAKKDRKEKEEEEENPIRKRLVS
jgi:hypothetical protein